ncbi:hypothetical protein [Nocardia sp. NBC_00511]|uniref:hypothetical protein n=1 Tax=Nocardia sp. NBC_00511 TaxID=2903591 RepID=UPI0030E4EAE1
MLGLPIENHEAVGIMTLSYARDVLRVHACCTLLVCAKKRQATALLNAAHRAAAEAWGRRFA